MILKISLGDLEDISTVVDKYQEFYKNEYNNPALDVMKQLKNLLTLKKRVIFALYDQTDHAIGFTVINPSEGEIRVLYVQDSTEEEENIEYLMHERQLFNAAFTYLKDLTSHVRIATKLSANLKKHIIKFGFQEFRRARLAIDRETVKALVSPKIDSAYILTNWDSEYSFPIADLMAKYHYNDQHPDGTLFAKYRGVSECKDLIENIMTVKDGLFKDDCTGILIHRNKVIGACFSVIFSEQGFIPEIILASEYQGKGLGKALLVHTIKKLTENHSDLSKIELNVTLINAAALKLYKSVGFREIDSYSVFIWNKIETDK
ncbi:MAG: GNAT family N-acetyltransferase [Promethearchaeota archaeon]